MVSLVNRIRVYGSPYLRVAIHFRLDMPLRSNLPRVVFSSDIHFSCIKLFRPSLAVFYIGEDTMLLPDVYVPRGS